MIATGCYCSECQNIPQQLRDADLIAQRMTQILTASYKAINPILQGSMMESGHGYKIGKPFYFNFPIMVQDTCLDIRQLIETDVKMEK